MEAVAAMADRTRQLSSVQHPSSHSTQWHSLHPLLLLLKRGRRSESTERKNNDGGGQKH